MLTRALLGAIPFLARMTQGCGRARRRLEFRRAALIGVLALLGCGPMIYGHNGPPVKASHLLLVIHNDDPGYHLGDPAVMTLSCWTASTVTSSSQFAVPALGESRIDLGTVKPDGFQLVGDARAFFGIPNVVGGFVLQSPDYAAGWTLDVFYPSGAYAIR